MIQYVLENDFSKWPVVCDLKRANSKHRRIFHAEEKVDGNTTYINNLQMTYLGINLKENNKIKKLNTWRDIVHSLWGLRKMLEWGNSSEWHWAEWGKRPVGEPPGEPCVCIPGEPEPTFLDRRGKFQLSGLLLLLSIHKTNTESWRWSPRAWDQGRWARGAGGIRTIHSIRLRICEQPGHLFGLFEATWTEAINPLLRLYAST